MSEAVELPNRRRDWVRNHWLIEDAFYELLKERNRLPMVSEIAERSGIEYKTCERHVAELKLDDLRPELKILTGRVLLGMAKNGMKGNAAAGKAFIQIVSEWSEKFLHEEKRESIDVKIEPLTFEQAYTLKYGVPPPEKKIDEANT